MTNEVERYCLFVILNKRSAVKDLTVYCADFYFCNAALRVRGMLRGAQHDKRGGRCDRLLSSCAFFALRRISLYIDTLVLSCYTKHMKSYYVYIATNKWNKTLYVGMTNSIERRLFEHEMQVNPESFTAKYNISKLFYLETTKNVNNAIVR